VQLFGTGLRSITLGSADNSRALVSSYPEFSQFVNEIGKLLSLARAQCVSKGTPQSRDWSRKKMGRFPPPLSTPHLTDPTIAAFLEEAEALLAEIWSGSDVGD
jgi:hypothetical protein